MTNAVAGCGVSAEPPFLGATLAALGIDKGAIPPNDSGATDGRASFFTRAVLRGAGCSRAPWAAVLLAAGLSAGCNLSGGVDLDAGWFVQVLARDSINVHHGKWEYLWSPEKYSAVALVDEGAVLKEMLYTLGNPVAASLVKIWSHWPGAISGPRACTSEPLDIERPEVFFREAYREAWKAFEQGARDVVWPAGTYWMRHHAGCPAALPS